MLGRHVHLSEYCSGGNIMHGLIYLVGLVVVIIAVLSFFGLR
jgi:hypothetical protein